MSIQIRLVGGPADGRTLTASGDEPPPRYLIPIVPPLSDLLTGSLEPMLTQSEEYEPLREGGWPRRDDDGTYLYEHRPAPVTAEQRAATEQARREAQAAEAAWDAGTDSAWQEIRKERPGYPEDWRDLF